MERTLLAGSTLDLGGIAVADETVGRLELLQVIVGVVDEGETGGLSATEVGAETEDGDSGLVGLVKLSELGAEIVLGDVGTSRVEDVTSKAAPSARCPSARSVSSVDSSPRPTPPYSFSLLFHELSARTFGP